MSLKALKIVKEEFQKIRREAEAVGHQPDRLDIARLADRICERIEKECIEQEEPEDERDTPWCRFCGLVESECSGGGWPGAIGEMIAPHEFTRGGEEPGAHLSEPDFDIEKDDFDDTIDLPPKAPKEGI